MIGQLESGIAPSCPQEWTGNGGNTAAECWVTMEPLVQLAW